MPGYRVTITEPGKHPVDGRFTKDNIDSKRRYYRLFHYKADARQCQLELEGEQILTVLTPRNVELPYPYGGFIPKI